MLITFKSAISFSRTIPYVEKSLCNIRENTVQKSTTPSQEPEPHQTSCISSAWNEPRLEFCVLHFCPLKTDDFNPCSHRFSCKVVHAICSLLGLFTNPQLSVMFLKFSTLESELKVVGKEEYLPVDKHF